MKMANNAAAYGGSNWNLGPRCILMPAGNPATEAFYQSLGVEVLTVAVDAIVNAAGTTGCMTGIAEREISQ